MSRSVYIVNGETFPRKTDKKEVRTVKNVIDVKELRSKALMKKMIEDELLADQKIREHEHNLVKLEYDYLFAM